MIELENARRTSFFTKLYQAHGPAMTAANASGIPQTVFYHPDWGFSNHAFGGAIERNKATTVYVTWLPDNYFD